MLLYTWMLPADPIRQKCTLIGAFIAGIHLTCVATTLPSAGLLCDLDAAKGVHHDHEGLVYRWENQAVSLSHPGRNFVERAYSNRPSPESRPQFNPSDPALNGNPSLIFRGEPADGSHLGDDLINMDGPDVYDHLTQGSGYTWAALIKPYEQYSPLRGNAGQDINIFFGNLRNGGGDKCDWCGFWGGISSDPVYHNFFWAGSRGDDDFQGFTGTSGHYRSDGNPHVFGKPMQINEWRIVAGRMGSGTGRVKIEIFMDTDVNAISSAAFFVESEPALTNPDVMAVGTERDAANHPGRESFDGEIARFLVWERPLTDQELSEALHYLNDLYLSKKTSGKNSKD